MPARVASVVAVCLLALPLAIAAAAPSAAQSEPSALQKFLGGIGLIDPPKDREPDYRERAPLVVPPSNTLIQPHNAEDVSKYNPDWPRDHDLTNRGKNEDEDRYDTANPFYTGAPLSPAELSRTGALSRQEAARRESAAKSYIGTVEANRGRISPSELGFRGWGAKKEETVVFTGEPPRKYLTDPPPGLFTPSSQAPYGIVTKSNQPAKTPGPLDRGVD